MKRLLLSLLPFCPNLHGSRLAACRSKNLDPLIERITHTSTRAQIIIISWQEDKTECHGGYTLLNNN